MFPNFFVELAKLSQETIRTLDMDFSDLILMGGGSVISAVNTREILSKTGVKSIIQVYGATEIGFITLDDVSNFVEGSAGLAVPNIKLKVKLL